MLFRFFKNKEIEERAKSMAARFVKRCPPEFQDDESPMALQKRQTAMQSLNSEVTELRKRVGLGWYRRAQLANTLKWELKERGYKSGFVNTVVYDMLIELASRKA